MGETDETGKLTKAYGFNPIAMQQGLWSTNPIWQANVNNGGLTENGTSYHYLHTDHLGTPQLATTKEGQTSWKAQSEAFGAAGILQSQSTITMNLRFPGQYYDEETGTHYNFFRDYGVNIGRYIQADPIKLEGGVNVYSYLLGRPLVDVDVYGLYGWSDVTAAYAHYCDGSGTAWTTSFGSINWGDLDQRIEQYLIGRMGGSCVARIIPINTVIAAQTKGADAVIIGRHGVRVSGQIAINCDCTWSFNGVKKSDQGRDLYNFNPSNRSFIPETMTTIGRNICNGVQNFYININGQQNVALSGSINGANECICRK